MPFHIGRVEARFLFLKKDKNLVTREFYYGCLVAVRAATVG